MKNKKILTIVAVIILLAVVSLNLIIRSESAKITTFKDCERAGWLVRSITVYDGFGDIGRIEKECTLWTGKSFLKQSIFFPTQKEPATAHNQALLSGSLKLIDGCLRVNGDLIVWPYGFSPTTEEGVIQVIDSTHETVARVGDKVRFGGGGFSEDEDGMDMVEILDKLSTQFPTDRCSGPYWIVGEVITSSEPK